MKIAIISQSATFDAIKKLVEKEGHSALSIQKTNLSEDEFKLVDSVDLVIASHMEIPKNQSFHKYLKNKKIPYLFCNYELSRFEEDRFYSKRIFNQLKIRTQPSYETNGEWFLKKFKAIKRPFVAKVCFLRLAGRQTTIVTDDNYQNLFGFFNKVIKNDTEILIEQYVNLKEEYATHFIVNSSDWKYLGSVTPYKKAYDLDRGPNTPGMGAITKKTIHKEVFEWINQLVNYMHSLSLHPLGIFHLGIGVDKNDCPIMFELNTRPGYSLHNVISSLDNSITDIFYQAALNKEIPTPKRTFKQSATVNIMNGSENLKNPAVKLPIYNTFPDELLVGLEQTENFYLMHSSFTSVTDNIQRSIDNIYQFLDQQNLGQFYYRRDIGK